MKKLSKIMFFFLTCAMLALTACDDDSSSDGGTTGGGTTPSWQTIFEDDFSGAAIDSNLEQVESAPAPYSLTGSGELQIDGESGGDEDGATFVYKNALTSSHYRVSTKFRVTMDNAVNDNLDFYFMLNSTSDTGYAILITSDPDGSGSREYEMEILKFDNNATAPNDEEELALKVLAGTKPQIGNDTTLIVETIYNNGTITCNVKDEAGTVIDTLVATDTTYTSGQVGFGLDLNLDADTGDSIFADYFKIEVYE